MTGNFNALSDDPAAVLMSGEIVTLNTIEAKYPPEPRRDMNTVHAVAGMLQLVCAVYRGATDPAFKGPLHEGLQDHFQLGKYIITGKLD